MSDYAVDGVMDQMSNEADDAAGEWSDGFPSASKEAQAENCKEYTLTPNDFDRAAMRANKEAS